MQTIRVDTIIYKCITSLTHAHMHTHMQQSTHTHQVAPHSGVQTVVGACVFLAAKVCGEEHHRMPTEICKLINSKHVSEAGQW